jgi:predicted amidohydrolase YtcJ
MDSSSPFVEAIAIQNDRILAIGSNEEILNLPCSQANKVNMEGKCILPGFTDSHIHLNYYAKSLTQVDCETASKAECLDRVRKRVGQTEAGKWVIGHGWNQHNWPEGYGTLEDLDSISETHPIYLTAKSLHAGWANSRALALAGINAHTKPPDGGMIGKNSDGSLNGLLFEKATLLIENSIPEPDIQQIKENLQLVQTELWKFGITSVHDFDGADCFSALQLLESEDRLRLRVLKSIPQNNLEKAVQLGLRTGFGTDFLKIGSVKLFADGALGPQTAAMTSPYENNPANRGILLLSEDEIFEYGILASQSGVSMAVHAIGDLANETVLKGYQKLRAYERQHNLARLAHRIEHVQILTQGLLSSFSDLDITASVQPIHLISDMDTADKYWGERSRYAYPFRSLLDAQANMIFGSDSPVESPNPFIGIHAATTRTKTNGYPSNKGWYPDQKISLMQALLGYTRAPAKLAGWKSHKGRIFSGEQADLMVLADDIFDIPVFEIKDMLPLAMMVAGKWVWEK